MVTSWVPVPPTSDFPVQNLPYGVFARPGEPARVGVAIGDRVLDLSKVGVPHAEDFAHPALNTFMARGRASWSATRRRIIELLTDETNRAVVEPHLVPMAGVELRMPFAVADYVDFYASIHHASTMGRILRPGTEPLTPNWRHLPIGYHGRAGTVVVSGTPIVRPRGQRRPAGEEGPAFGPSERLDVEAEVGFVVGTGSRQSEPVSAARAADHIFGVVLVNDWSARDIQAWEYVPLGPFLGKSFATSISPWVVPLEALAPARVTAPVQTPPVLPYLRAETAWGLDIAIEVSWNSTVVSRPPFREMYWTAPQLLAHLTVNGASLRTGDLLASGTVSGPERDQAGSFMELTWNGSEPITLADGSHRTFLNDGDTVTIRATAPGADGVRIGFGEVSGTVLPAR
jgi:fumarylacetoacetase